MMQPNPEQRMSDLKNMLIAFALSVVLLFAWTYFFPPANPVTPVVEQKHGDVPLPQSTDEAAPAQAAQPYLFESSASALENTPRISLRNDHLQASVNLVGGRLDDVTLTDYRETLDPESPAVTLLSPAAAPQQYFAQFGWLSPDGSVTVPTSDTEWRTADDDGRLLQWQSDANLFYQQQITLDGEYLFTITQTVTNRSDQPVRLSPFALLNREHTLPENSNMVSHEGLLGVFNGKLEEHTYGEMKEDQHSHHFTSTGGWTGIGDKYWFTALIPPQDMAVKTRFHYYSKDQGDRFQTDVMGPAVTIAPGQSHSVTLHLFAGPKELTRLDTYGETLNLPLFDRAVDFGMLYFLTKPIFIMLHSFYEFVGNFGVAILLLTLLVRLLMFPLANQSYRSMAAMRALAPKMQQLREKHQDDPMVLNREMMSLYKQEGVNPLAGCLPLLVQIPIFFALYKVLYVTIEMRHAPFYGYLRDLSAPDPMTVLNLFGTIPWQPPGFLAFGILPVVMFVTMMVQQKLQPAPTDPTQAKVMKFFPYMLLIICATFPAGLVLYWSFSNLLSIAQQAWMNHRYDEEKQAQRQARHAARAPRKKG